MCSWSNQAYPCQLTADAQTAIETKAALCTTWGNVALDNSNIDVTWVTAGVYVDMDYDEGNRENTDNRLNYITDSSVDKMREMDALLNQYNADLLVDVFWRSDYTGNGSGAAGRGWVPPFFPNRRLAFSTQVGAFGYVSCCASGPFLRCCSAYTRVNDRFVSKHVYMATAALYRHA